MATSLSEGALPSPEELAAIVAAVALAWPSPPAPEVAPAPPRVARGWRFSGRWWDPGNAAGRRP